MSAALQLRKLCREGNETLVRQLLQQQRFMHGSYLCAAAYLPSIDAVELLLHAGDDPNERNVHGLPPLLVLRKQSFESALIARALIARGADVNIRGLSEGTALMQYVKNIDLAMLLVIAGADINAIDRERKTALHLVPSPDVARELLRRGAHVNARDHEQRTPLHYAARSGAYEVVKLLVDHGVNLNTEDKFGRTSLADSLNVECARILLTSGADSTRGGQDAYNRAAASLYFSFMHFLLLKCASLDVNCRDNFGDPAIVKYARDIQSRRPSQARIRIEWLRKLLTYPGVDVNARDASGNSALHILPLHRHCSLEIRHAINGDTDQHHTHDISASMKCEIAVILDLLLAYGTDVNATNSDRHTPLEHQLCVSDQNYHFCTNGWKLAAKKLIAAGAWIPSSSPSHNSIMERRPTLFNRFKSSCATAVKKLIGGRGTTNEPNDESTPESRRLTLFSRFAVESEELLQQFCKSERWFELLPHEMIRSYLCNSSLQSLCLRMIADMLSEELRLTSVRYYDERLPSAKRRNKKKKHEKLEKL